MLLFHENSTGQPWVEPGHDEETKVGNTQHHKLNLAVLRVIGGLASHGHVVDMALAQS